MTLLITVFAAVISTILWYLHAPCDRMKLSVLALMYWGAALMWMGDAIFEYVELREAFFEPRIEEIINDAFLGFAAVAFGLIIWLIILLVKDPKGVIRKNLSESAQS